MVGGSNLSEGPIEAIGFSFRMCQLFNSLRIYSYGCRCPRKVSYNIPVLFRVVESSVLPCGPSSSVPSRRIDPTDAIMALRMYCTAPMPNSAPRST
ncbi:unnamed protein product [Penicillium roqueforti FM164]|uniref:Genomic scaffold, ProqFM164S02 n=1 Tax=Penicillium roqueforti (strain FM164) TaxID=1365484 RepID=W6Q7U0_PENRF|nr:unnamed protein product [Penicillium roqueforti FM164]